MARQRGQLRVKEAVDGDAVRRGRLWPLQLQFVEGSLRDEVEHGGRTRRAADRIQHRAVGGDVIGVACHAQRTERDDRRRSGPVDAAGDDRRELGGGDIRQRPVDVVERLNLAGPDDAGRRHQFAGAQRSDVVRRREGIEPLAVLPGRETQQVHRDALCGVAGERCGASERFVVGVGKDAQDGGHAALLSLRREPITAGRPAEAY